MFLSPRVGRRRLKRLPSVARAILAAQARREGLTPERFMEHMVSRALADHARQKIDHLGRTGCRLLARASPAYLVIAVGHVFTRPSDEPLL
jgi:hypothetical protein